MLYSEYIDDTAFLTGGMTNTGIPHVLRYRYFAIGIIPIPSPFTLRYRDADTDSVLR